METHKEILSAIIALADCKPLSVTIPFRGHNVVFMDAYNVRAYKVGNCIPLVVEWEDITSVEAMRLYTLARMQQEAELILKF